MAFPPLLVPESGLVFDVLAAQGGPHARLKALVLQGTQQLGQLHPDHRDGTQQEALGVEP